jgi:hypothetical protein
MKHLNDTEKHYECRATLEYVLRALRYAYNQGLFDGPVKRHVFNVMREGDTTIRKISE